mgnify:FL=1
MFLKRILLVCLLLAISLPTQAQNEIIPVEGYSTQIGIMVFMLDDMKDRISNDVKELSQEQTDFLFDDKANSIGAIIMHLIATEAYYQTETLEGRPWTEEEKKLYATAGGLGAESRDGLKGKPIQYYLDLWDEVRKKSHKGLKEKDDEWFAQQIDEGINNHYVWYHVLEHAASHMGQISLIKARLPQ